METTIQSLRVTHHQPPPFIRPVCDSTLGPLETFNPSVLRIRTSDGLDGLSLTTYIEGRLIRTVLAPIVLGSPVRRWEHTREKAFWALRHLGHDGLAMNALSSLDIAVHDLLARMDHLPLWRKNESSQPRAAAYATAGWTNLTHDQLVASMYELVERGFTTVKMKIGVNGGRDPDRDVERVHLVRDAVGPDVALAVDANQCWDASTAVEVARRIADDQIAWFEEPVFAFDRRAAIQFRKESPIPIASGESEHLPVALADLIARGGVDIAQAQPFCCGGVTGYEEMEALARGDELTFMASGPSFFTATLAARTDPPVLCEYVVPHMDTLAFYFRRRPRLDNAMFHLGEQAGWGLETDDEFLRTHPGPHGWESTA